MRNPVRLKLPRYVRRKWLAGANTWGHFFEVPTWAKANGCPLANEALGTDYDAACHRAETVLLNLFDSWRSAGRSDLVPDRVAVGTFDWLAATYKASEKYTKLGRSQRKNHELGLSLVGNYALKDGRRFGALALRGISTDAVDRLFGKLLIVSEAVIEVGGAPKLDAKGAPVMIERERRTTVNHAMKSCRRAWNVVRRGNPSIVPEQNPFSRMGLKDVSKVTPTGTYDDLLAFVAGCDAVGHPSLGTAAMVAWEWLQREEHIFGALKVEHYRPRERPDEVFIVHPKTGEEVWIPLFHRGEPLFPELVERLDAVKRSRIGGLLVVRDWSDKATGHPVPWISRSGDLTYMRHSTKAVIRSTKLPPALTFQSWRHGGMTELGDADLTDAQIRAISRHKDVKTLPRYVKKTQAQIIAGTRKRRAARTDRNGVSE
ncbi:hypothetical protein [uncultured Methylobacterium sp.]|uniref:hypothetical protein n=1 Tax=uncultured Methylobacterium sp. TaxID=157278 RepID=UPI0035CCA7B0